MDYNPYSRMELLDVREYQKVYMKPTFGGFHLYLFPFISLSITLRTIVSSGISSQYSLLQLN